MFTTPAPAAPTVTATTVSPASPSHSRPSRLRELSSSLRSYTHGLSHSAGIQGGSSRVDANAPRDPPSQVAKRSSGPRAVTATVPATATATTTTSPPTSFSSGVLSHTENTEQSTLSRSRTAPEATGSPAHVESVPSSTMTRSRTETATQLTVRNHSGPTPASPLPTPNMEAADNHGDGANGLNKHLPSIRLIPHQDPRAGRPSLQFATLSRTLPSEADIIRVGRYSERDNIPDIPANIPSAAAVGFKSKVVSRKHCELWCKDSQWYIKDVKSSSGTFLNHIRLSQPNVESKPFKLKDGDIIQLGIDFRGGEEMIFRCVKIRIECNRGWQQGLNTFNKQTHQRLRALAKSPKKEGDAASTHTSECSICLMSIAPCQSLFVAPCSHVWHYKCIRPILNGPTWPNFLCPNCRAVADLEADVEDPGEFEEWDDVADEANGDLSNPKEDRQTTPRATSIAVHDPDCGHQTNSQVNISDLEAALSNINIADSLNGIANQPVPVQATPQRFIATPPSSSVTQPVTINISNNNDGNSGLSPLFHRTGSDGLSAERAPDCPMTPRNDAGPFVLDGSAGRASNTRPNRDEESASGAPVLPPLQMD